MRGRGHRQQKEKGEEEKEINPILSIYCDVVAAKCSYEHLVTVSGRVAKKAKPQIRGKKHKKAKAVVSHFVVCQQSTHPVVL